MSHSTCCGYIFDCAHSFGKRLDGTYGADVLISNFAEEELWTVGDGLPCTQRVDVLLPVFNLRMRKE